MPTYITLFEWTQNWVDNLKGRPKGLDEAKEIVKAAGDIMHAFYMPMGRYDGLTIGDAASDEA